MLSLRAFIAIIAATSLSSNVVAQPPTIGPNWGMCGGRAFWGGLPDIPCNPGWTCTVASERHPYRSNVFLEELTRSSNIR